VEIKTSLPEEEFFHNIGENERVLVLIDDLMHDAISSQTVVSLFTTGRHIGVSTIFLTQNIFAKGKFSRDISLNANYICLMKNIRDNQQIDYLSRQIFTKHRHFLSDIFSKYLHDSHPYLLIDLRPETSEFLRVKTDIFSWKIRVFISDDLVNKLKEINNSDKITPLQVNF